MAQAASHFALGIIGIVAAMTLPALISKHEKLTTATKLKKSYSVLAQAIKMSEVSNGSLDDWDYTIPGQEFWQRYLTNYISISNRTVTETGIRYRYLNGEACQEGFCVRDSYTVFLSDGSSLIVSSFQGFSNGRVIMIDINGFKEPNMLGKDVFVYAIIKKYGLSPFGYKDFGYSAPTEDEDNPYSYNQVFGEYNRDILTGNQKYACNKNSRGVWCAALIIMDGWEIKKDYPW
ncbi:MAG: hypothetical protein KIC80_00155 [Brachyspira sp.]|nr:hypothetical protein [Brachyspira sp.]